MNMSDRFDAPKNVFGIPDSEFDPVIAQALFVARHTVFLAEVVPYLRHHLSRNSWEKVKSDYRFLRAFDRVVDHDSHLEFGHLKQTVDLILEEIKEAEEFLVRWEPWGPGK